MHLRPAHLLVAASALGLVGACRTARRGRPLVASVDPMPRVAPMGDPVEARPLPDGARAAVPLAGGAWARWEADGQVRIHDADGTPGTSLEARPIPDAGCALLPWGARCVVRCDRDPGLSPGGDLFTPATPRVGLLRAPAADLLPGREGRTLTRVGPCRPRAVDLGPSLDVVACTLSPDRPWREWTAPGEGRVVDVYDGLALVALRTSMTVPGRARAVSWSVRVYDIDHGQYLPTVLGEPTARWVRAGFAADGRVVGVVHTGTVQRPQGWYAVGSAGASLRMIPLPVAADDVGALDDERAVFTAGPSAVVTADGALFRPVQGLSPEGATGAINLEEGPRRAGERVRCAGDACAVDGAFVLRVPRPGEG